MKYKPFIINKAQAIEQMNQWGKEKKPFLFITSFNQKQNLVLDESMAKQAGIHFQIGSRNNSMKPNTRSSNLPSSIIFEKKAISQVEFSISFNVVKKHLDFGNTYLINLTKPSKVKTNLSFSQIFYHSKAPYKLWIEDKLVVFSPEIFVKIKDGIISSYPMKGTIDAALSQAKEQILKDPKEIAEHHTIVDLIRNDLSMVSKNVRVKRFRYIDEVKTNAKTLLQVSSEIVGEIDTAFFQNLGDHFYSLLPAGSISGAPKAKTVEIIEEAEQYEREFYTGIFGFFDGESLDSAVMIRFMEKQGGQVIFKSGGGITTFSNCEKEYEELKDKVYVPIT
ncbi:MAG: aminodeoxychorismate synthase component I [Bacteroidales bacterium]|nr:aminodeoxychorismate synthase component I [Bacteroidales bacterium]